MSAARDAILAKLRSAPQQPAVEPDVAGFYAQSTPERSLPERLKQFRHMLEAVHTEVYWVRANNWEHYLATLVRTKGHRTLLLAPDTPHGARAAAALRQQLPQLQVLDFAEPLEAWKDTMFTEVDAAFTGVRAGIADTGTLILWPDQHEPRSMSLVPPVHYALFDAGQLYQNFYQAMASEAWNQGLPTNCLLISGPSKTADIQQTLAYGAHGPRELVVLVIVPDSVSDQALKDAS